MNSSCAPNAQVQSQCFHTIHKHCLLQISFPGVFLGELFPFSLSPVQLQREVTFSWGRERGGEKGRKRVVSRCSYTSLPLALSPRFWAPLLVHKQCILSHHSQTAAGIPAWYCCCFISTSLITSSIQCCWESSGNTPEQTQVPRGTPVESPFPYTDQRELLPPPLFG